MLCLNPVYIPRKRGINSSISVPCGKCAGCLKQKRLDWTFRLKQELKVCKTACFVTLTYSNEHIVYGSNDEGTLWKKDVQDFIKRLRINTQREWLKANKTNDVKKYKSVEKTIKYFLVGEYGSNTFRPHYHGVFFNLPTCTNTQEAFLKAWGKGYVYIGSATAKSLSYTAKYCISEITNLQGQQKNFMMVSKGMGKSYVTRLKDYHNKNNVFFGIDTGGGRVHLPRYYREKLFDRKKKFEAKMSDYAMKVHQDAMKLIEKHRDQGIDHKEWVQQQRQQIKESIIKNSKKGRKL